jgi:hypothetical protein
MSEDKYCVYSHATNGRVFSVGAGTQSRPHTQKNRTLRWATYVRQHPAYKARIRATTDNRNEALSIEAALIEKLDPVCNVQKSRPKTFIRNEWHTSILPRH